jgi:hypothetical protein
MTKVYTSDVGTVLLAETGVDLGAAVLTLQVRRPGDVSAVAWPGTKSGTTKISYTLAAGDLPAAGTYRIQAKIVNGASVWLGETYELTVYEPFK